MTSSMSGFCMGHVASAPIVLAKVPQAITVKNGKRDWEVESQGTIRKRGEWIW